MTDIDPAATMAKHDGSHCCFGWFHDPQRPTWNPISGIEGPLTGPCEPYRLAEALAVLRALTTADPTSVYHQVEEMRKALATSEAKVARINSLAERLISDGYSIPIYESAAEMGEIIRAALADQPEQAS